MVPVESELTGRGIGDRPISRHRLGGGRQSQRTYHRTHSERETEAHRFPPCDVWADTRCETSGFLSAALIRVASYASHAALETSLRAVCSQAGGWSRQPLSWAVPRRGGQPPARVGGALGPVPGSPAKSAWVWRPADACALLDSESSARGAASEPRARTSRRSGMASAAR